MLKPLIEPWIKKLKKKKKRPILLEDGAPAHSSKIANEFLQVSHIDKML